MDLLRHLRFFVTVADERHFGNAADELGMTQPPLSQGIRRLEERWGVRLFERSARGVSITDGGAALLPSARQLLREAADLEDDVARLAAGRAAVRVASAAELRDHTPRLVAALAAAVDREVAPVVAPGSRSVPMLLAGQLDLAVVRHPCVLDGTEAGPVVAMPRLLCVGAGVAAESVGDVGLPLVAAPRSDHPAAHDQDVDVLRRHGHSGRTVVVRDPTEQLALAAAGRGCVLVVGEPPAPLRAVGGTAFDLHVRVARRRFAADDARLDGYARVLEAALA